MRHAVAWLLGGPGARPRAVRRIGGRSKAARGEQPRRPSPSPRPRASRPGPLLFALVLLGVGGPAGAHHDPGHGPSEATRQLSALGTDPAPRQRVAATFDVARSSEEPTLNRATTYALSLIGRFELLERWVVGADLPTLLVNESQGPEHVGLGDVRLVSQWKLGSLEARRPSYALGLSATLPTRTFRMSVDPGRQWGLSPSFQVAGRRGRFLGYALLMAPAEWRPAGLALDASAALGGGVRFAPRTTFGLAALADVRLWNLCDEAEGMRSCPDGRASEAGRPVGATRLSARAALNFDWSASWTSFLSGQLPVTTRRDVEWSVGAGTEWRF